MAEHDRLTDLERTQRFHETVLARHDEEIRLLRELHELSTRNLTTLTQVVVRLDESMTRLDVTMQAIRDLLSRGDNGH